MFNYNHLLDQHEYLYIKFKEMLQSLEHEKYIIPHLRLPMNSELFHDACMHHTRIKSNIPLALVFTKKNKHIKLCLLLDLYNELDEDMLYYVLQRCEDNKICRLYILTNTTTYTSKTRKFAKIIFNFKYIIVVHWVDIENIHTNNNDNNNNNKASL